jgi:hypothetical protein
MPSPRRDRMAFPALVVIAVVTFWAWSRPQVGPRAAPPDPEKVKADRVDAALDRAMARLRFKQGLLEELAAGSLALREAAARLAGYHAREPAVEGARSGSDLMRQFPGDTEEERCARSLAEWVRRAAFIDPSNAGAARRVERELAEAYGEPGAAAQPAE